MKKFMRIIALCICIFPIHAGAKGKRIAVLISNEGKQYDEVFAGFKQHLGQNDIEAEFDVINLKGDAAQATSTISEVKRNNPDLIFCVGALATDTVCDQITDIPIIASLIFNITKLKNARNVTSMSLEFPIRTQLQWLKRFLPTVKTIGVLYSEKENQTSIDEARLVSAELGLRLEARVVNTPRELPMALNNIAKNVDVIWGVPDNIVLNPLTAKKILIHSFRKSIPFIGISSSWVKAGALYALERDYTDIGIQCGRMSVNILQGEPAQAISLASSGKVKYFINAKTAEYMKIQIPKNILGSAEHVY